MLTMLNKHYTIETVFKSCMRILSRMPTRLTTRLNNHTIETKFNNAAKLICSEMQIIVDSKDKYAYN